MTLENKVSLLTRQTENFADRISLLLDRANSQSERIQALESQIGLPVNRLNAEHRRIGKLERQIAREGANSGR